MFQKWKKRRRNGGEGGGEGSAKLRLRDKACGNLRLSEEPIYALGVHFSYDEQLAAKIKKTVLIDNCQSHCLRYTFVDKIYSAILTDNKTSCDQLLETSF